MKASVMCPHSCICYGHYRSNMVLVSPQHHHCRRVEGGRPVQITGVQRSVMGCGAHCVACVFCLSRQHHCCRLYTLSLSDQTRVTLQLTEYSMCFSFLSVFSHQHKFRVKIFIRFAFVREGGGPFFPGAETCSRPSCTSLV